MSDPARNLPTRWARLLTLLASQSFRKPRVTFFLGTDVGIAHERRVAMTPNLLDRLGRGLRELGLVPRLLVAAGAGERAKGLVLPGFADEEYRQVGAEIVEPKDVGSLGEVDVFHALKEPTEIESELPSGFLRIGALHLASKPPGVCRLLATKNFSALIDGGTVGNCAFLELGGDRTPIVASMSRFAGALAGLKLLEGLRRNHLEGGRVVIVGGGIAGMSAIGKLDDQRAELVVVDPYPPTQERLGRELAAAGFTSVRLVSELTGDLLDGAVGIIFAHRSGAKAAEKVCNLEQIRRMRKGGAIIDIAIDQGGSIAHPDYREEDDAVTAREKYHQLLTDYFYYAETNMPRDAPREASEVHGEASLPYVAMLLALSAIHGGPQAAAEEISRREPRVFTRREELDGLGVFDALVQDLRNGVQLTAAAGAVKIAHPDIAKDAVLSSWIANCAGR